MKNKLLKSKWPKYVFVICVGILLIVGGIYYRSYHLRYISTGNAYINGNIVQIAPRVTGLVEHLYVENHEFVKKGQLLFELDRTDFKLLVDKAMAQFEMDQANLQNIQVTSERIQKLVEKDVLSRQTEDDIVAKLKTAKAAAKLSYAKWVEAKLKLEHTRVVAPSSGWIAHMSLREGNIVSENQPIFALISDVGFWVDANFKETELKNIKENQEAHIKIDMYPDKSFIGIVKSISGGSGNAFSLLPSQNATGNWVKITQRVPVRIHILATESSQYPLRIGTSATVTIDLQSSHQDNTVHT